MKILILSDLHLEFRHPYEPPDGLEYDVVVLAGDIHTNGRGVKWAQDLFDCPVIYVPGNHEFYGASMPDLRQRMQKTSKGTNVHVLDARVVVIDNDCAPVDVPVRFIGSTLWTDFALPFEQADGTVKSNQPGAMFHAFVGLADYAEISGGMLLIRPEDTLCEHEQCLAWLKAEIARPWAGKTVVVTHHAPSANSVHPRYRHDYLSPAFASDLDHELFAGVDLWVHGHMHDTSNYVLGETKFICNPRGYLRWTGAFENHAFDPGLVVEI